MKKRIAIWGDSLLKGVVYDEVAHRYRFSQHSVVDLLRVTYGQTYDFTNLSQYGQTTSRALPKMKESLKEHHDYDIAIIELGGNDCDFDWKEIASDPDSPHTPKTPLEDFKQNLTAMVLELRHYGITPVFGNLPPINAERYFDFLSQGLDKDRILVWLRDVNNIYHTQERYSLVIDEIARELAVPLINVRTDLLGERDYNDCLCSDGIHLNEQGHERLKNIVVAQHFAF